MAANIDNGAFTRIRYKKGIVQFFDFKDHKYRSCLEYTKAQKRIFHKTFSGLQVGFHKGQRLIFLTLTTEYRHGEQKNALLRAERELNAHWQKLKQNVDYHVQKWRFDKWYRFNYGKIDRFDPDSMKKYHHARKYAMWETGVTVWEHYKFRLCYFKVRTKEGGGVIHCLIRKSRDIPIIAQKFLKREWDRIHGAEQVWIEEIKAKDKSLDGAMNASWYFCGNYFNQQPVIRASSSFNWIFRGAQALWSRGKHVFKPKKRLIEYKSQCTDCHYNEFLKLHANEPYVYAKKSDKPNYLEFRKSLLMRYGYNQALAFWLHLTRNPPANSTQKKLFLKRNGEIKPNVKWRGFLEWKV